MFYEKMCLKARNLGGYPVDGSDIPNNHRLDVNKPCINTWQPLGPLPKVKLLVGYR